MNFESRPSRERAKRKILRLAVASDKQHDRSELIRGGGGRRTCSASAKSEKPSRASRLRTSWGAKRDTKVKWQKLCLRSFFAFALVTKVSLARCEAVEWHLLAPLDTSLSRLSRQTSSFSLFPAETFPLKRQTRKAAAARFEVNSCSDPRRPRRLWPANNRKIQQSLLNGRKSKRKSAKSEFSSTCSCHDASRIRSTANSPTTWRSDSRRSQSRISIR